MTIDNLKELEKIMKLCHKHSINTIKIDGIELTLTLKTKEITQSLPDFATDFPESSVQIKSEVQQVAEKIATEELTPEQLMFYSSIGHTEAQ